jgi:hypothetical protein
MDFEEYLNELSALSYQLLYLMGAITPSMPSHEIEYEKASIKAFQDKHPEHGEKLLKLCPAWALETSKRFAYIYEEQNGERVKIGQRVLYDLNGNEILNKEGGPWHPLDENFAPGARSWPFFYRIALAKRIAELSKVPA